MNNNTQKKVNELENINSIKMSKEKKELSLITRNESISIINDINNNEKENKNEIKIILNKIQNLNNSIEKNLIFECPNKNCPLIPDLKYYEFTQSVATKCRFGHEYHLSLVNYYEIIFNRINSEKYCYICSKKNYSNNNLSPQLFCINCRIYICKRCQLIHNQEHQLLELHKVNNFCPNHDKNRFSGFCNKCQKDLCIFCLKDHYGGHHSLLQYCELVPNKEKINSYRAQINNEIKCIDYVKNIIFDNNMIQNKNEKNLFSEFFDKMKLKYYFYDSQLQTYDKKIFNMCIIKNVINLFLIKQNFFNDMYNFLKNNLNENNKIQIINKLMSTIFKYQNKTINLQNLQKAKKISNTNLSHFEFKPLFSLDKFKNIRFLYLLKSGKFIACVDKDGLYVYDDCTFVELLYISSETDIIDLCEDDSGLIFVLKKSTIEIIRLNENLNGYTLKNKILFKSIDKANFICSLINGTIIVSRTKKNEGNLEIWMKAKVNNIKNQNNIKDKKTKSRIYTDYPGQGRNIINMFNNNRRLEIILRRRNNEINTNINNNINLNYQNNNNNINNNINNNNINNNNTNTNNNNNNNIDNNNNNENNNNANNNNNGDEDNNEINDENNNNNDDNNNDNENDINNNNNNNNEEEENKINLNRIKNIEQNSNDNVILQEILPNNTNNIVNNNNNNINIGNNNNNNNNNNANNLNLNHIHLNNNNNNINYIIRGNRGRLRRQNSERQHPRFVHVIRFIRDQLQGLVNNLEQEELVLEDPSLISSVGIYGAKDPEIIHLNKIVKNGHEIVALLDWNQDYFICSEFSVVRKNFRCIRIYSSENYEPLNNGKIKIKHCSRDKNALIKIDNDIFAVCYDIGKMIYGISLISFNTREEITRIELPRFNLAKKIYFNKSHYLFILLDDYDNKDINRDMIKVMKIVDKELVDSSSYFFETWLNTYVYNKNSNGNNNINNNDIGKKFDNRIKNKDNKIKIDVGKRLEEEQEKENEEKVKELKFMNIINSFDQNNHNGKEIISMLKLKNNTFVFLNKSHSINIYKVE